MKYDYPVLLAIFSSHNNGILRTFAIGLIWLFLGISLPLQSIAQDLDWVVTYGGNNDVEGSSLSKDGDGNLIIGGSYSGTADLDPGPAVSNFTALGYEDVFIQKLDSNGNFLWAKSIHGSSLSFGESTVDDFGNIYLTGSYRYSIDFDPGPNVHTVSTTGGNAESYILKLDPHGDFLWVRTTAGSDWVYGEALAIDQDQNVVAVGNYKGTTDFDPGPGSLTFSNLSPDEDAYIWKLDSLGNLIWAKEFGHGDNSFPRGIEVDEFGNILITGTHWGIVDLDPGTPNLPSAHQGSRDVFLLKLNPSGDLNWARVFGSSSVEETIGLATDSSGSIYMAGEFRGTVDFDPGPGIYNLTSGGDNDIYTIKLDSGGNFAWGTSMGDVSYDLAYGIFANRSGYVVTVGNVTQTVDLDPGPGNYSFTASNRDIFIQVLDHNGDFVWARGLHCPGLGLDKGKAGLITEEGDIVFTGGFGAPMDFDPSLGQQIVNHNGDLDAFVSKWKTLPCSGIYSNLDSLQSVGCNAPGYVELSSFNGTPPYFYSWANYPSQTGSSLIVPTQGIQAFTMTDANGCTENATLYVQGPDSSSAFDLIANMTSSQFVAGNIAQIFIDAHNSGCTPVSGDLILVLDSNLTFQSAIPSPSQVTGNTIMWTVNQLTYDSAHFTPVVEVIPDSMAIPGQSVCFDLSISYWTGDGDSTNNLADFCGNINNSADPNDKRVFPKGECTPNYIVPTQRLTYAIRFQNTGNYPATNIFILDSLSSDLDLSTFRILGQSHDDLVTEILPGNILKFNFDNIYLPDSASDPSGSQGYIMFEIYPNGGLSDGVVIENRVSIYFDFNFPVVTNSVMNTIISSLPILDLSVSQVNSDLIAGESGADYQWFNCTTGLPINGATGQTFSPTASGNYAVEIESAECSGISDCYSFTLIGLASQLVDQISVFPNPSQSQFTLDLGTIRDHTLVELFNSNGQMVHKAEYRSQDQITLTTEVPSGLYFLKVQTDGQLVQLSVQISH